jgi:YD repeat-containing protein
MKPFLVLLLSLMMTTGSLFAADTKRTAAPGTDDLSHYVAAKTPPGGQTTLRDVSGRTLGTASTLGTRTTTFRDSGGRTTGTATIQGNQTVFRDASGRTVGTAATSGSRTTTYRDAAGRTQGSSSESGGLTNVP